MANFNENQGKMTLVATAKDICTKEGSTIQRFISKAGQPCFMIGSMIGHISSKLLNSKGEFIKEEMKKAEVSLSEWETPEGTASCYVLHRQSGGPKEILESFSFED